MKPLTSALATSWLMSQRCDRLRLDWHITLNTLKVSLAPLQLSRQLLCLSEPSQHFQHWSAGGCQLWRGAPQGGGSPGGLTRPPGQAGVRGEPLQGDPGEECSHLPGDLLPGDCTTRPPLQWLPTMHVNAREQILWSQNAQTGHDGIGSKSCVDQEPFSVLNYWDLCNDKTPCSPRKGEPEVCKVGQTAPATWTVRVLSVS